jgi:YMGG-like Gly-zipper/Glycine-zipper domain
MFRETLRTSLCRSIRLSPMKTILSLAIALVALVPAQAQLFRPAAVNGALLGGLAGAIIGNNSGSLHHNGWQGAAIGAGAGLLIGSAIDANRRDVWYGSGAPAPRSRGSYVYRNGPAYRSYSYPYGGGYYYSRPDYRGTGVILGGISGAIIGNNSRGFRHNGWRGAAWGAGLGYIVGAIAEDNARYRYREPFVESVPVIVQTPSSPAPAVAQPQQVTIINNYYNTPAAPMAAANGLFGR